MYTFAPNSFLLECTENANCIRPFKGTCDIDTRMCQCDANFIEDENGECLSKFLHYDNCACF